MANRAREYNQSLEARQVWSRRLVKQAGSYGLTDFGWIVHLSLQEIVQVPSGSGSGTYLEVVEVIGKVVDDRITSLSPDDLTYLQEELILARSSPRTEEVEYLVSVFPLQPPFLVLTA